MFAVLFLPNFRLQAVSRFSLEAERAGPWALVDAQESKSAVLECNEAASHTHVHPGLSSAQAQARCPALRFISRSPAQEECTQATLLELAITLAPQVENSAPGYCTIQLATMRERDWPGLGQRAVAQLTALQLRGQIGIAPNPDLALLAARQANRAHPICIVEAPEAFLTTLPIAVLEPAAELAALLRDWGIHTLGQLTALPRGELMNRLGMEAAQLWERAAGHASRPLRVMIPGTAFFETIELEHELETVEPLLFLLRRFLEQLRQRLENAWRVASRLSLTLILVEGEPHQREFTIPAPTAEVDVLFRILQTHLESLQLPHAIIGLRLQITPTLPERQQHQLFENPLRDPNRFGETLGRLAALVGAENVGVALPADTHRPDSFQLAPPRFHELPPQPPAPPHDLRLGLPLRRYRPPLPATVRLQRHLPAWVNAGGVSGAVCEVLGPYRLSGNWWDPLAWALEEWDIALEEGGLYRLTRSQDDCWLLEGCYAEALR